MKKVRALFIASALMTLTAAASAQTTTGATPFDPTTGVTSFSNQFGAQLNTLFPLMITIILTGAAFRIALKWIKRGTKV